MNGVSSLSTQRLARALLRLDATLHCDVRLQFRNGFYYVGAFTAVVSILVLRQLHLPPQTLSWLMPVFLLGNMSINTFYFIAGLVLLEKGEGTLEVQVVTPLRSGEYLASKVLSLGVLALAESLLIVLFTFWPEHGFPVNLPLLALGVLLGAVMYSLYGFMVVVRYDSVNEFLFPSMLYTLLLGLPVIPYFGFGQSWLYYLHPLQAPLLLLQAAFQPLGSGQLAYALLYGLLWAGLMFAYSRKVFFNFVIAREGVR
jgi:fluoroquinolone transport system permease protein